jgi:cation transport ATPase
MAVALNADTSTLKLHVQTGTDTNGKPKYADRSFSSVKAAAADQGVYDVAVALAGLQSHPLASIIRVNTGELVEV